MLFSFQDKETGKIVDDAGQTVTITLIPTFIYDHIVKRYLTLKKYDKFLITPTQFPFILEVHCSLLGSFIF